MAYDYSDLVAYIDDWAQQAVKTDWIDQQQALSLTVESESSASELFDNKNDRPLIVAFMGGTGVGKSSLLNKLSGRNIAKTGIERPTSREVTLYHHQSVSLKQLENTFPLQ
ncbi:MAG: GTP-binding protein, partial [Methylococcaceae bacterium]|nr:GTP-binding protein [Methylococcaceae bacterium]